jgi:hypothetical protein
MKHKNVFYVILSLMFFITIHTTAYAFDDDTTAGLSIGINMTDLKGDDIEDASSGVGLTIGGFVKKRINENFSFQPEFYLTMRAASDEMNQAGSDGSYYYTLKEEVDGQTINFEMPLLGRLDFPIKNNLSYFVLAGPYLSLKLSESVDYEGRATRTDLNSGNTESASVTESIGDELEAFDYGLILGTGIAFDEYAAQIRYHYGLSDIASDVDAQLNIITILFSYSL